MGIAIRPGIIVRAAAAPLALAAPAAAEVVFYDFTGSITTIDDNDGVLAGASDIAVGDAISGRVSYDTMATLTSGDGITGGASNIGSLRITVQSADSVRTFREDHTASLQMQNNHSIFQDRFAITGFQSLFPPEVSGGPDPLDNQLQFSLEDQTESVFSSLEIPGTLDLSDFDLRRFSIIANFDGGESYRVSGVIDTLTLVPSPGAAVAMGVCGMAACRRRRW